MKGKFPAKIIIINDPHFDSEDTDLVNVRMPVFIVYGDCRDRGELGEEGWMTQIEMVVVQVKMLSHCSLHSVLDGAIDFKVSGSEKVRMRLVEVDKVVSVREGSTMKVKNAGSTIASSLRQTLLG